MANFTGTTSITIVDLGKLVTTGTTSGGSTSTGKTTDSAALFKVMTTGSTFPTTGGTDFTNASQIDTTHEYISFSEDYNQYNVVYFFSASSIVVTASTYAYTGSTSQCSFDSAGKPVSGTTSAGKISIDSAIYQIQGATDVYAIRVTVPEAYAQTAPQLTLSFAVDLFTNDPEIHYAQTLSISQLGCANA